MRIVLRSRGESFSYREVMHESEVIAAIWKTRGEGRDRYSVVLPEPTQPRMFATLTAAKRWVTGLRSTRRTVV